MEQTARQKMSPRVARHILHSDWQVKATALLTPWRTFWNLLVEEEALPS